MGRPLPLVRRLVQQHHTLLGVWFERGPDVVAPVCHTNLSRALLCHTNVERHSTAQDREGGREAGRQAGRLGNEGSEGGRWEVEAGRNNSGLASWGHPSMTLAPPAVSLLETAAPPGLWRLANLAVVLSAPRWYAA